MKNRLLFLTIVLIGILGIAAVQGQDRKIIDVHLHSLELDMLPAHWDSTAGHERPASAAELHIQTIDQLKRFSIPEAVTSDDVELFRKFKETGIEVYRQSDKKWKS